MLYTNRVYTNILACLNTYFSMALLAFSAPRRKHPKRSYIYCTVLFCTIVFSILPYTILYCIPLHCTVLLYFIGSGDNIFLFVMKPNQNSRSYFIIRSRLLPTWTHGKYVSILGTGMPMPDFYNGPTVTIHNISRSNTPQLYKYYST